ncbi:helix-turn-helix transcriptional regulator [Streptomyces calidiresistens]|nr:helix-turn-helix domain-containing protein [Streptomyces calidiresistens]
MATGDRPIEEFAGAMRRYKERSGLGYGTLARKLHPGTSTLHRYCSGEAVPPEYAPVERLARLCGAEPAELVELHRLWVLADDARRRGRGAAPASPPAGGGAVDASDGVEGDPGATSPSAPVGGVPVASTGDEPPRTGARLPARALGAVVAFLLLAPVTVWVVTANPLGVGGPEEGDSGGSAAESRADGRDSPVPPVWTVRPEVWSTGCGHPYLVDAPPAEVPEPPLPQDAVAWVRETGAVAAGHGIVEITLRVDGGESVVVDALHVRVVERGEPLDWPVYTGDAGCGGALTPASFTVDPDDARPVPVPTAGFDGEAGEELPPPRLPFRITEEEPLVLRLEVRTETCHCSWYPEVEWSGATGTGLLRVGHDGGPFRTSGAPGNPVHLWDGTWLPIG